MYLDTLSLIALVVAGILWAAGRPASDVLILLGIALVLAMLDVGCLLRKTPLK